MSEVTQSVEPDARRAKSVPFHRTLPNLVSDPLKALLDFAESADGEVVRVSLGSFRLHLVSNPAHIQRVLRDNSENYVRDGKLWWPVVRLFGDGVMAAGPIWDNSRRTLQPHFTTRQINSMIDQLADTIGEAVDELEGPARSGQPVDMGAALSDMVCRAILRVLFADRVSMDDAMRVVSAQDQIARAMLPRLFAPFVPQWMPFVGDRAFMDAVRTIDDVLLPVVREARSQGGDGDDVFATLSRARDVNGDRFDERQVRNDAVAMFATTTETTYGALTFLWPLLQAHPDVADRLYEEVDAVVGQGPVRHAHLPELRYTRMVLEELLRLYPVGWLIPRTAVADDVVGRVRVPRGATILMSPYITQRMGIFWDNPEVFDPERFTPDRTRRRHKYTHFPFGGGPHQCLGQHLFYAEALIIVATILSRFRFQLSNSTIPPIQLGASLRSKDTVELTLSPRERSLVS